jgi:hypothetical protein
MLCLAVSGPYLDTNANVLVVNSIYVLALSVPVRANCLYVLVRVCGGQDNPELRLHTQANQWRALRL